MTGGRIHDETSVVALGGEFCPEDRFEVQVRRDRYGILPTVAACDAIAKIFDKRLTVRQLLMGSIVIELPMDEETGDSAIPKHQVMWMAKKFTWILHQAGVLDKGFVSPRFPAERSERPKPRIKPALSESIPDSENAGAEVLSQLDEEPQSPNQPQRSAHPERRNQTDETDHERPRRRLKENGLPSGYEEDSEPRPKGRKKKVKVG